MTSIFGNNCTSTGSTSSGGGGEPEDDPLAWKLDGNSFTSSERKLGTIDDQDVRIITEDADRIVIEEEGDIVLANNSVLHSRRIDMTKVERFTNHFDTGITFVNDRTQADITIAETAVYTTALIFYDDLEILSAEIKILDSILNSTTIKLGCCTADRTSTQAPNPINRTELTITGLQQNDILKIEIDQTDDLNRTLNIYKNDVLDQTTPIVIDNSPYRALRIYALSDVAVSSFALGTVIGENESNAESSIKTTFNFRMLDVNDNKFLMQEDEELQLLSSGVETVIINNNSNVIAANSAIIHNREINQNFTERFTDNYKPGEGIVNFSNSQTRTTNTEADVANYTMHQVLGYSGNPQNVEFQIKHTPGVSEIFKFGVCLRDDSFLQSPATFNSATLTGLSLDDVIKIEYSSFQLRYFLNDVQQGNISKTLPNDPNWRWFIQSDASSSEFQLLFLKSTKGDSNTGEIKVAPNFSIKDYNDNKFLEHKNEELKIAESGTDIIRIYQPLEGSEGQEFEPLEEVVTAMGSNITYAFDDNEDVQTITVNTSLTSSSIPNLLPFRPTSLYTDSSSVNFIVENLEVISSGSIGIGLYSTPPLNYETATGDPSSLYGTKYVSFNSSGVLLPASLDSVFTVIYRAARPEWKSIATHDLQLSLSSEQYQGKDGLMINFTVNDVLAYTVFAEVLDSLNPSNTSYEIYYLQPTRGTIKFDTDLATDGSNVQIQGYEVKKEFDRLLPYDNTSFNIADSAGVGVLTEEEYVIDFDNGSNNDFTITEVSDTEVTVVKATNTAFSISYSQNPIDVAKYDWVIECLLNSATGSSFRFQLSEIQYVPTTNAEPFTDGDWGTGYSTNFRPNTGSLYTTARRLNNVNTTSEIIGLGASLDKMRYTIVNGLMTAEYQLSTDSSYQPSPVLNIDLLEGVNNLYYISANDSQTNNGGFNANFIFTRTVRDIDTPSIQLNDNNNNVINFQGDLEIKSNAVQYMDMADSSIMLNQPMMLHSGDYAYMYILPTNAGTMFWNSEANKLFVCDGDIWNVPGETMTVLISNENFGGVDTQLTEQGYVLIPSATRDFEVRFADSVAAVNVMGIIAHLPIGGILLTSTASPIPLAMSGYWDVAVEADTYTRDDYLASTAAGIAYEKTGTSNTFAISSSNAVVVTDGDKIRAWLHCVD